MKKNNSSSDEVALFRSEETESSLFQELPLGRGVKILCAESCGLIAFEKPAGTLTHPNSAGLAAAKNALLVADYSLKNECYSCRVGGGKIRKIYILNRLDSPTSGVVLASTDEKIAVAVRRAFLAGTVRKVYCALVSGDVKPDKGEWKDFLRRVRARDGTLRVEATRGNSRDALFAETHYSVLQRGTLALETAHPIKGALLKLEPITGRTHQLRVQCALRKIPILGDKTYGDFHRNTQLAESATAGTQNRLYLHALETELSFPWRGKTLRFVATSPLPDAFRKAIR